MGIVSKRRAEVADRVGAIPRNGWWHPDGEETFIELAADLVTAGLTVDRAIDVLERAYGAVAGEFGA